MLPIMSAGMSAFRACIVQSARISPIELATMTRTRPSIANNAIKRAGDAPSASRTAISRLRDAERASNRLELLIAAIKNSSNAPPSKARSIGRMSPVMTWLSGTATMASSRSGSGYSSCSCCAIDCIANCAPSSEIPSLTRPMTPRLWHPRSRSHGSLAFSVIQKSAAPTGAK